MFSNGHIKLRPAAGSTFALVFLILCRIDQTLSQNSTTDPCTKVGPLKFVADRGETQATVNYTIPVEHNVSYPVSPVTLTREVTVGIYLTKDLVNCFFELHLIYLKCNISELNSELIVDKNCENLIFGRTCLGYCPEGQISIDTPPEFTCESDDKNTTYWVPNDVKANTRCIANESEALKCPDGITLYAEILRNYTRQEWTIPRINDSYGEPWNITYESFPKNPLKILYVGKYSNMIAGVNSKGQTSSCTFEIEVKERRCSVPTLEGTTLEGELPNATFGIYEVRNKTCTAGYAFPETYDKTYVRVQCRAVSGSTDTFWYASDDQVCSRKYMPFSCNRNLLFKDPAEATGSYEFVYDKSEWEEAMRQNKTHCSLRVRRTTLVPTVYNLKLSFPKTTNVADVSKDLCFFEVLLYTGRQTHNTPVKVFDCALRETVDMKWPTSEFLIVFRLYDNATDYSATGLLGNGTIDFSFTECTDCDFENITGIEGNTSTVPFFEYYPVAPCRLTGCLENSLQGFKVGLHAENRDSMFDLVHKRCNANFKLENQVKKICLHQTKPRTNLGYCRLHDFYSTAELTFGSGYKLELYCDDLQGWWCLPSDVQTDFMNITWTNTFRYGNDTQQLWIVSVSKNQGYQTCAEPYFATTVKPTTTKRPKIEFPDYTKNTIIGVCISVAGAFASACAGCACWKKRKSHKEPVQQLPLSEDNANYATQYGVK